MNRTQGRTEISILLEVPPSCPFEACRIRSVSDPNYAKGMLATGHKLVAENGVVNGLYSDFGPMVLTVSLGTDVAAGVVAPTATRLHTTDGILSEVNKKGVRVKVP